MRFLTEMKKVARVCEEDAPRLLLIASRIGEAFSTNSKFPEFNAACKE